MGELRGDQSFHVHVLSATRVTLDGASIAAFAGQIEGLGQVPIALDLSSVRQATATGWSALIELLARHPQPKLALCGLSRPMLSSAIDLSLAELCEIYVDVSAFRGALEEREA